MSEAALRRGRITREDRAAAFPPYPADWYIDPPLFCVEIVSESRPEKDYTQSPLKYAVNGTRELWVFDPKMCRSQKHGGPIRLQVWRRDDDGNFDRVYAGEGPVYSNAIQAWIFVTNEGLNVNIADDAEGTQWWMTPAERERAAKLEERAAKEAERTAKEAALKQLEQERLAKEQERLAKEQALARVAQLEAMLAGRAKPTRETYARSPLTSAKHPHHPTILIQR